MAQYGRPISDISTGGWGTTPLWSKLDDNDDADFITSSKNPSADTFENALTNTLSDPSSSSGHIIKARLRCDKSNNGTATMYLYQGTTLIATYSIPGNLATAFTTYSYTLTSTEANSITDYTALRIRVSANATANAYGYCAWTELEIPDASGAVEESVSLATIRTMGIAGSSIINESISLATFKGTSTNEFVAGDNLLHITFEGGDKSEFDSEEAPSLMEVNASAALIGNYGLQVTHDNNGTDTQGNNTLTITSNDVRFRFYFKNVNLSMAASQSIATAGITCDGVLNDWLAFVRIYNNAGTLMMYGLAYTDTFQQAFVTTPTSQMPVSAETCVEIHVKRASTDSASDGEIHCYFDEVLQGSYTTLDNYDLFDTIIGSFLGGDSADTGCTGVYYLDDFIVRDYDVEIGMADSAIEESVSLAKYNGASASELTNVQESITVQKTVQAAAIAELSIFDTLNLSRIATLAAEGQLPPVEESVTLILYKDIAEEIYIGIPEVVTLSKFAEQNAVSNTNVQESVLQTKKIFANLVSTTLEFETVDLNKVNTLTSLETIWVAPVEESVSLAKALGLSSSLVLDIFQSANLARFAGITQAPQVNLEESLDLFKAIFALANSQVNVNAPISLSRSIFALAANLVMAYELMSLGIDLDLIALEEIGGIYESINLAKFINTLSTSQVNVNDSTALNRINTVPATNLGSLFDLATLSRFDALTVLEETQGQINESVVLAKFMDILAFTQVNASSSVTLAQLIGTGPATQGNLGESINLSDLLTLSVFEQTQGQTNESVTLARVMGLISGSKLIGNEAIILNSQLGISSLAQNISAESVLLNSMFGLNTLNVTNANAVISLARSNSISLATNINAFDDVSLLIALLILAHPSSLLTIENAPGANAFGIRFRDKRANVIFRDKRAKGGS